MIVVKQNRPVAHVTVKSNSVNQPGSHISLNPGGILKQVVNQLNNVTDLVMDPNADGIGQEFVVYDHVTGRFVVKPVELEGGDF